MACGKQRRKNCRVTGRQIHELGTIRFWRRSRCKNKIWAMYHRSKEKTTKLSLKNEPFEWKFFTCGKSSRILWIILSWGKLTPAGERIRGESGRLSSAIRFEPQMKWSWTVAESCFRQSIPCHMIRYRSISRTTSTCRCVDSRCCCCCCAAAACWAACCAACCRFASSWAASWLAAG